jgi:hypothetical protein
MGQMEMKCIFDIGKNISILAKATQVSDVAHGPLVFYPQKSFCHYFKKYSDLHQMKFQPTSNEILTYIKCNHQVNHCH